MSRVTIQDVKSDHCTWIRWRYPLEIEQASLIESHFHEAKKANPYLWNGKVLMSCRDIVRDDIFYCTFFICNYATFLALRDGVVSDENVYRDVKNTSCVALIRSSDGGTLFGRMTKSTATPGLITCPGGIPDQDDIDTDSKIVNLNNCIAREVLEEVGFDITPYVNNKWLVIKGDYNRVILAKVIDLPLTSKEAMERLTCSSEMEDIKFLRSAPHSSPLYIRSAMEMVR